MKQIKKDIKEALSIITVIKGDILKIAGAIAMRHGMPSTDMNDWNFSNSITQKDAKNVLRRADLADEQCRLWAIELRRIADKL